MKKIIFVIFIYLFCSSFQRVSAQTAADTLVPPVSRGTVFGQIFADFKYNLKAIEEEPRAAFRFNQGILGYKHDLNQHVSGKIMLDVTRTTHFTHLPDALGVEYFEGSKYTAYLKMAEIKWQMSPHFTLRFGQLLNTQYLTVQDVFWGFRYVEVTLQEKFRMGAPADFGAQLDVQPHENVLVQLSVTNGEGPFRYQDQQGKMLYAANVQATPVEGLILKLYADYAPAPTATKDDKSVISFFSGFRQKQFMLGAEYSHINNLDFENTKDVDAFSVFGSVLFAPKFTLLARWDRYHSAATNNIDYLLGGIQYEPLQHFTIAVNGRYYSAKEQAMLLASFGLKF
ncbi:MAG TPA: hypothetical protein VFC92_11655 [Bacteroidales bacterium]|nr:hypothetical protein [Bacteroidales bacterium]